MLDIFLLRDVFESLKCCLDLWLSSMFDCIYVCVFLFLEKTVFKQSRQVNTHIGHIALRQATMGGYTTASSHSPPASKDESDDGFRSEDADEDDSASSPSDDVMYT